MKQDIIKLKVKVWCKPPRIRKRNRCCHKLELLKAVDDGENYYWEIKCCLRCGITEENYGLGCSYRRCLNCGKGEELLDDKNWLCPKCYRKTRSKKDKH